MKGHFVNVCRGFAKKGKKQAATIEEVKDVPDGESGGDVVASTNTISADPSPSFFYQIGGCNTVSAPSPGSVQHHIYDQFGRWRPSSAESHGEVLLNVSLNAQAYWDLSLPLPNKTLTTQRVRGLVNTGAQMCVAGPGFLQTVGLTQRDLFTPSFQIKGASNTHMNLLGAAFLDLTGRHAITGEVRVTSQMVYFAQGVTNLFLSLEASRALGIVRPDFPEVAQFNDLETSVDKMETSVSSGKGQVEERSQLDHSHSVLNNGIAECGCPTRELPPKAPTECPFNPVEENIPALKEWILEHYKSSAFNVCPHQAFPLVSSSPPMRLHLAEGAKPVAIHKPSPVPVHWEKLVKDGL